MEIRFYDNFNVFLRSLRRYTSVSRFFEGFVDERFDNVQIYFTKEARLDAYRFLSKKIYKSRKAQEECYKAMVDGRGDYSCFRFFYIESYGKVEDAKVGYSISGDAVECCKRRFLKSTR